MVAVTPLEKCETLAETAKRLRRTLKEGVLAHYAVSVEVMRLAQSWDKHKLEADGLEIGVWLAKHVDKRRKLSWYARRANAWKLAKDHGFAKCLEPSPACWIVEQVPEAQLPAVAKVLEKAYRDGGRVALNHHQVTRLCPQFVPKRKSRQWASEELKAARARIVQLESHVKRLQAQVLELGATPVD